MSVAVSYDRQIKEFNLQELVVEALLEVLELSWLVLLEAVLEAEVLLVRVTDDEAELELLGRVPVPTYWN